MKIRLGLREEQRVVTELMHPFARRITTAMCVLAVGSGESGAQGLAIPGGATAAQIIAHAEAEGAAFRRSPSPAVVPPMFAFPPDRRLFEEHVGRDAFPGSHGTANRTCAEGHELGPIRSGEFLIGGQLGGKAAMIAGRPGKVWWAPLHNARNMPPLLVRGRRLSAPNNTVRFSSRMVARSIGQPERHYFFPSEIIVPRPGRWLMIATSGANWGCFILGIK